LKTTIGIVAHDAGGAEIVSRLIRKIDAHFLYALAGPAVKIFNKNLGKIQNTMTVDLIQKVDYLICGTSWESTHENEALKIAKEFGVRVISVLDHYSSYAERYIKDGYDIIPVEIWVTDELSLQLARELNPSATIQVVGNPYLEEMANAFLQLEVSSHSSEYFKVLYLTEPISQQAKTQYGDENAWGFTEFDALKYFLQNLSVLTKQHNVRVFLRKHPSEREGKYVDFLGNFKGAQVLMSSEEELLVDIASADAIAGCDTMALLIGVAINKPVYSSLPPNTINPTLPSTGITYIREFSGHGSK
jgi:hypothetical protein